MTDTPQKTWMYFYPDDGETIEDARECVEIAHHAQDAAYEACHQDYGHDGWERGDARFEISVVSPAGEISKFKAWHEPSIEHYVRKIDD